jgi:uncharacterized phage infection (PIP) family protein YhgE
MNTPGQAGSPAPPVSARWLPVFLSAGVIVLLLAFANVQLWRMADRDHREATASGSTQLPPLPATSGGGNRALARETNRLERKLDRSTEIVEAQLAAITASMAPLQGVTGQVDLLTQRTAGLTPDVHRLAGAGDRFRSFSNVAPAVNRLPGRLGQIDRQLRKVQTVNKSLAEVNDQLGEVKSLRTSLEGLDSGTQSLKGGADTLKGGTDALNAKVDSLQVQMNSLTGGMTSLKDGMGDLLGSLGGLKDSLGSADDSIRSLTDLLACLQDQTKCPPQPAPVPEPAP